MGIVAGHIRKAQIMYPLLLSSKGLTATQYVHENQVERRLPFLLGIVQLLFPT